MTCDQRQIQMLQRAHGALEPELVSDLEAHLSACSTCGAFATAQHAMETLMPTPTQPNWTDLEARLSSRLAREQRTKLLRGGALVASLALLAAGLAGLGLAVTMPLAALILLPALLIKPRAVEVGAAREELLGRLRHELDVEIRRTKTGPLLLLGSVGFFLIPVLSRATSLTPTLGLLGVACLGLLVLALQQWLVRLPQLRLEREQLGEA